jgi:L-amino acid N-acyltransferase YncA
VEIRQLEPGDREGLTRFLAKVPEADRTFFKEDLSDPAVEANFMAPGPGRTVALEDGEVVGWLNVVPLHGWSDHVGELRLIVDPDCRGRGIGRALAQQALVEALALGLKKVVVEVIAVQEETIAMFRSLGFDPEALLADHVRDRAGELRDLMVLAHSVDDQFAAMVAAGVVDDIR